MKIYVSRDPKLINCNLPFIEVCGDLPYHPVDLATKAEDWILGETDFATCHEIPILVAQSLIRKKKISCTEVELFYVDKQTTRRIQLDIHGEMVEPWPENPNESLFELDFYLRYGE